MEKKTDTKQSHGSKRLFKRLKNRCLFLMLFLIVQLLIYHYIFVRPLLIMTSMGITLVAGVYAVSDSRKNLILAAITGLLAASFLFAALARPTTYLNIMSSLFLVIFYIFTLINILLYVIRGQKITSDKLYGALSVYLLIGFAWAPLYRMVYSNDPNAFSGAQSSYGGIQHFDFIYYSFSTICTLGFGDILPVSGVARSLSLLEAMTGVVYMAVMISRLVSLYRADDEE